MIGQFTPTLRAGGTIRPLRFVKLSSTDWQGLEADANELAMGVSDASNAAFDSANHATTTEGSIIRLQPGSIKRVECGGSITAGDWVESNADGEAVAATTTGTDVRYWLGQARQDGADGRIIEIIFAPMAVRPAITT